MSTPPLSIRLARRQVTLATVTGSVLLATGCTSGRRNGVPDLPGQAPPNPDRALVARALREETAMVDRLTRTARRHPGLRRDLRDPLAVHRSHVRLLTGAVKGSRVDLSERPPVPRTIGEALDAVVRAEQSLRDAHAGFSLRADSGAFARVLAGMAAAAAQQAVVLGAAAAPGPKP